MAAMAKSRLVFLPSPGIGHLVPMVELAKRFLFHHPGVEKSYFSVTILIPGAISCSAISAYLRSVTVDSGLVIDFEELPPVGTGTCTDSPDPGIISSYSTLVKSAVARLLSSSIPVAALVLDMFATAIIDLADELDIPCYMYYTCAASLLGLLLYLPTLHEKVPGEFEAMGGVVEVPGFPPLPPHNLPSALLNKKSRPYTWFLYHGRQFLKTNGIIVNTFAELEPTPLEAMANGFYPGHPTPPVYAVGPMLALGETSTGDSQKRHKCICWLDDQPPESVVFLCFGSHGCFDMPQVRQIAAGLEQSGHRFLWALRVASSDKTQMTTNGANLDEVLPEEFVDRTKGRGVVWPSWVPQAEILAHQAVGGFVTHCGWNSCLESLWFGVPMLGWPLYAEQHANALLMARDMGVALELKVDRKNGNFVRAEELEKGVRCLMEDCIEGRRVRSKVKDMKFASRKAMEEGGCSFTHMERLVRELRKG